METLAQFHSTSFAPDEHDEEYMGNEDVWGHELLLYLQEALHRNEIQTKEPLTEDGGWILPVQNPFKMWIGCGHIPESGGEFTVFFGPEKFVRRARQAGDEAHTELLRLKGILSEILENDPQITRLTWSIQRV